MQALINTESALGTQRSSFTIKASCPPTEVRLNVDDPGSKSAVPWNIPTVYVLSKESVTIKFATLELFPPIRFAHTKLPHLFSFHTKIPEDPVAVRLYIAVPGLKSTVPPKKPVQ